MEVNEMKMKTQRKQGDIQRVPHHANETGAIVENLTDEIWQAIVSNDSSYDDKFFYAVKSTGIFCRPSCKSRAPKKKTFSFFAVPSKPYRKTFAQANDANQLESVCQMKIGWTKSHNALKRITANL